MRRRYVDVLCCCLIWKAFWSDWDALDFICHLMYYGDSDDDLHDDIDDGDLHDDDDDAQLWLRSTCQRLGEATCTHWVASPTPCNATDIRWLSLCFSSSLTIILIFMIVDYHCWLSGEFQRLPHLMMNVFRWIPWSSLPLGGGSCWEHDWRFSCHQRSISPQNIPPTHRHTGHHRDARKHKSWTLFITNNQFPTRPTTPSRCKVTSVGWSQTMLPLSLAVAAAIVIHW